MWGPAGPDSAGQNPLTRALVYQRVPAGVHHTNTETERPKSIVPQRSIGLFAPLTWADVGRQLVQAAGAVLSRASRRTRWSTDAPAATAMRTRGCICERVRKWASGGQ